MILGYSIRPQMGWPFVERLLPTGQTKRLGSLEGNPRIILESRDGELWVGTDMGLWRREGGGFLQIQLPHASGHYPVRALAEDREGRIFAGAYHYGLYRLGGTNRWQRLTTATDAGSKGIWAIYLDDEGTLWVATDTGLARWREGRWNSYAGAWSALPRLTRSVICDRQGAVWLAGQFGVARVERRKLHALAAGQDVTLGSDWFDRSDGLPSIYCAEEQDALHELPDGRIWVATAEGAAVLDLEEWRKRRQQLDAPSVHIEAVMIDDKSVFAPGTPGGGADTPRFVVPPGAHRLELRFTAINLTSNPKSRFRYRLEGTDKKWLDGGELRTAVYHHLRPGDYRFQVIAANNYGLWNSYGRVGGLHCPALLVADALGPPWPGRFLLGLLWCSRSIKLRQLRRREPRQEEFSLRLIESQEAERKRHRRRAARQPGPKPPDREKPVVPRPGISRQARERSPDSSRSPRASAPLWKRPGPSPTACARFNSNGSV